MKRQIIRSLAAILCGISLLGFGGCATPASPDPAAFGAEIHDYVGSGD